MRNFFKREKPMQRRQPMAIPKKKSCIIKERNTGDDMKLEISPDCKQEHVDAYLRGKEEKQIRRDKEDY